MFVLVSVAKKRPKALLFSSGSGAFVVGNTVSSSSGGSGTVTYVDTVNSPQNYIYIDNVSGSFNNNDTITDGGGASYSLFNSQNVNRYHINGVEGYTFNLNDFNTYRIDTSDSSNVGHPIQVATVIGSTTRQYRDPGTVGSYFEITVADVSSQFTSTAWSCQTHGTQMTEDGTVNFSSSGSTGTYGSGLLFDI